MVDCKQCPGVGDVRSAGSVGGGGGGGVSRRCGGIPGDLVNCSICDWGGGSVQSPSAAGGS